MTQTSETQSNNQHLRTQATDLGCMKFRKACKCLRAPVESFEANQAAHTRSVARGRFNSTLKHMILPQQEGEKKKTFTAK